MLEQAVAAVKVDQAAALAKFDEPNGDFKDRDLTDHTEAVPNSLVNAAS